MLEPLELPVFPSCYNCLSWSEDGEIALATGEHVQILSPKNSTDRGKNDSAQGSTNKDWHTTRFRANIFTGKEWPPIYPQDRDQFSIGAEQSISPIVGLSWSPPGPAKYRRCVLAVLTANLLLSFYEAIGSQGKWVRICIVNKALESYFNSSINGNASTYRKTNIRSFAWAQPLKVPSSDQSGVGCIIPRIESRWGVYLLTVTNDANDIILLQVKIPPAAETNSEAMQFQVLAVTSLQDSLWNYPAIQPNSIFASNIQSQTRALSLTSGPWLYHPQNGDLCSATVNVASIYGTKLRIIKITITIPLLDQDTGQGHMNLLSTIEDNSVAYGENLGDYHFTGSIKWIHQAGSEMIYCAVGVLDGVVLLSIPEKTYNGHGKEMPAQIYRHQFFEDVSDHVEGTKMGHYEKISGMGVTLSGKGKTPTLHIGTVGGYTAAISFQDIEHVKSLSHPSWKTQLDDLGERFDIDRDLGSLAISRIWGLASSHGILAVAVTLHPGDMIEYRTSAEERTTILFSAINDRDDQQDDAPFHQTNPDRSVDFMRGKRDVILRFILQTINQNTSTWRVPPKIIYASACCAIVDSHNIETLSLAQKSLEMLMKATGADLTNEIDKCSSAGNSIDPKPVEKLDGPGKDLFEKCEICGAGIGWYSAREAQCATGHLFVRCNLTSLAIQEPGTSKFCSACRSEYLDGDLLDFESESNLQQICRILSDIFDTCIYCGGKFRS